MIVVWLTDDNLSEDDMNECVKEDGLEGVEHSSQQSDNVTKKKKKKGQDIGMRWVIQHFCIWHRF